MATGARCAFNVTAILCTTDPAESPRGNGLLIVFCWLAGKDRSVKIPAKPVFVVAAILLLVGLLFVALSSDDEVAVRTWVIDSNSGVPELADEELAVPWLRNRASFGIAFSGGGTRSAAASLGELRALHELGWLHRARHIASNSGGSWVTVPYTFLPLSIADQRFLGDYIPPEDLVDQNLSPSSVDPLAFGTAIHNAATIGQLLEVGRGDEAYSDIVASIFLQPFGLHDNEKLFTFHQGALEQTLAANPSLSSDDFQTVRRQDRPYLVVTGVMIGQQLSQDPEEYFPVEMTPLYTGIRGRFELEKDDETVIVGGGYVESFGYDSYEPQGDAVDGRWRVRLTGLLSRGDKPFGDRNRFTLSDVIGASSAAPLATLSRNFFPNFLFPEFRHWPVDQNDIRRSVDSVRRKADEFQHGDGADMDNLALTPLLARKTENILVFINSADAFRKPPSGCGDISEEFITDDVISFFRKSGVLIHNIVLAGGDAGLAKICEAFASQQSSGEPLVYCQPYDVIENARHRIEPYRASICWVYLDRTAGWIDKLDPTAGDLVRELHDGEGSFDTFPHYSTFAEQGISMIDLNRERVVALSNLAAWTVKESADYIATSLGGAELPMADTKPPR